MEPINNKPSKGIIALDCDGVLLNYHETFAQIYHRTFSTELVLVSPSAYHVSHIESMLVLASTMIN